MEERTKRADDREEMLADIAANSGMSLEQAREAIQTMSFPDVAMQLSQAYFGGDTSALMQNVAEVFVGAGVLEATLPDYADTIDTAPLEAAR